MLSFCIDLETISCSPDKLFVLLYLKSHPTFHSVKTSRQLRSRFDQILEMKTVLRLVVLPLAKRSMSRKVKYKNAVMYLSLPRSYDELEDDDTC